MNLTPQQPRRFIWQPGSRLQRDGVRRDLREKTRNARALEGHKKSAHAGKFVKSCPACKELKAAQ